MVSGMCIDYRSLNDITIDDSYPLPNTKTLIQKTKGAKLMSKIDLADGFHQIQGDTKNAPSTFQRFMEHVLADEIDRGLVVVYIDDILVFDKLKRHNLKVKEDKCTFGVQTIEFLGNIVGNDNVVPLFSRVKSIIEWPEPTDKTTVGSFMVKSAVASAVSLNLPDTKYPFYLECDASNIGIGSVLYQLIHNQRKVLAFISRKLTGSQLNWTVLEKEAYAIVKSLELHHFTIFGFKVIIKTDHKNIEFLRNQRVLGLNQRINRWMQKIDAYDVTLEYIKGTISAADGLHTIIMFII
ncbi:hypothetical protein ACTFIZ_007631 [Dictyostelium cf. discoideum]